MRKLILSIAVALFTFSGVFSQRGGVHEAQQQADSPLKIVKKVYPSATKIVTINNIWSKAVDKRGKVLGYTINSTKYTQDVRGFKGPVPVLIVTDKSQRVKKVALLENHETPQYLSKIAKAGLFNKWNGKAVKQLSNTKVDGVTGATFSSKAIIKNVQTMGKKASQMRPK
jgi:uncharacterized protein with FMN-binding domain